MSHRGGSTALAGNRRDSNSMSVDDPLLLEPDNLSDDDDNAQEDFDDQDLDNEDPLLLAIDDLEGRVAVALEDIQLHPGISSTDSPQGVTTIHNELAALIRPVIEVAAHTAPSVARTYHRGVGPEGVENSMDDVYQRIVADLVLPVMLEIAQSDPILVKRGAALEFFRTLWKEYHKSGSWLDITATGLQQGPYGAGGSHQHTVPANIANNPAMRAAQNRRQQKRLLREGEILRYWIEASNALLNAFDLHSTDSTSSEISCRCIISASASIRPAFSHLSQRIKDADDRGAARMYALVMRTVEAVLKKMFLGSDDSVRSACIKFLEIVILCCSRRSKDAASRRRTQNPSEGFSLDDLPGGHPIITQEDLESIAEYTFATLRGLALLGGQVKIDVNILSDMMMTSGGNNGSPIAAVVSILKPAALAFLDIESSSSKETNDKNILDYKIDRSNIEFDFFLSQKPYALTINALSALAMNRPDFFKDAALTISRRAADPPIFVDGGPLDNSGVIAIVSHLKATCLTLLRNPLSVTTNASTILQKALEKYEMELQAEKALSMANQAISLLSAGRAARNREKMFYQWDSSETDRRSTKRQRETDDALAKMRAAKAARGLGNGIQLPTSMSDAIELILLNLPNLPKQPVVQKAAAKSRVTPVSLQYVIDAITSQGASLVQEEGRWYDRDGGTAWSIDITSDQNYEVKPKLVEALLLEKTYGNVKEEKEAVEGKAQRRRLFSDQCQIAASDSIGRMLATSSNSKSKAVKNLCSRLVSRLAFTLENIKPSNSLQTSYAMAKESLEIIQKSKSNELSYDFLNRFPLAATSLALEASTHPETSEIAALETSLSVRILNEALVCTENDQICKYDESLETYFASVVRACALANEKLYDNDKKMIAKQSTANLMRDIVSLPRITKKALVILCGMCDIHEITQKASDASRRGSQESGAFVTASHDAKLAAEKRAQSVLLTLRDIAFQRDDVVVRKSAVQCAVSLASGFLPSSLEIQDKALKITMNILYTRNEALADLVVDAAIEDFEKAANVAIEKYEAIQKANKEADAKTDSSMRNPLAPRSDEEKKCLDQMRWHALLAMAVCVNRIDLFPTFFIIGSRDKADVLAKAIKGNMQKLSQAVGAKHGAAKVARQVADLTGVNETPLLLSFIENLVPMDKSSPDQDLIEACFKIQESKSTENGKKDPRFIIPIVSAMKRHDLIKTLPEFVSAGDNIFLAALARMRDRVGRQALLFRDEIDEENPTLHGMTLCEQLVFLHKLDFAAAGLPQKRYLAVIKLCLDGEEYNDQVLMYALDYMSETFLAGTARLPLAFMLTCIRVCNTSKHESLHSWIGRVLLPRLVESSIWNEARQWEGWMRCAHMLENNSDPNISSREAIDKLPPEQLAQYRAKWTDS